MNLKSFLFKGLCGVLLCGSNSLFAQTENLKTTALSFEQSVSQLKLNSYLLKQSEAFILQKQMEQKAARGLFMPTVKLSAKYVAMSEDLILDMSPIKDAISPLYETLGTFGQFSGVPNPDPETQAVMPYLPDNVSTDIVRKKLLEGHAHLQNKSWETMIQKKQFGVLSTSFTMPLFTGGKILAANKAAGIELSEAQVKHSIKEDELFCELVERYYGLALSTSVLAVRNEVKQTMDKHLSDAQHLKKNGMIADAEFLHAKVYSSQADREYKKALRQQQVINDALLSTLSVDSGIIVNPLTPLFYHQNIEDLAYFKTQAQENCKQLALVNLKKELAHQGYVVERANYLPTVAAMGNYDLANKDLSEHVPEYFVGVGLSWTVFDGASRLRKTQAARLKEQQVEEFAQQAQLNISTAVSKYYQELQMHIEQLNDLETAYSFAKEYYRVREQGFSEGMATTTEVADASLALAKVNIEKLQAMYNYDVALAKLLFYSGKLDKYLLYANDNKAIRSKE